MGCHLRGRTESDTTEELTPQKDGFFNIADWNSKMGKQIPGVTGKFGLGVQNEAGQRLAEFGQENALVIGNTLFQQHKRRFYTWTSPDAGRRWGRGSTAQCLEERIKQRGYDHRPEDQHSDRNLGPVYQGYTYQMELLLELQLVALRSREGRPAVLSLGHQHWGPAGLPAGVT